MNRLHAADACSDFTTRSAHDLVLHRQRCSYELGEKVARRSPKDVAESGQSSVRRPVTSSRYQLVHPPFTHTVSRASSSMSRA